MISALKPLKLLKAAGTGTSLLQQALKLSLSFLTDTLDSRITFTRASSGMHFDSTGLLVRDGYNLLLQSADYTTWTKAAATVSDTTMLETVVSSGHSFNSPLSTVAASTTLTVSAKMKGVGRTFGYVQVNDGTSSNALRAYFNLATGAALGATSIVGSLGTVTSSSTLDSSGFAVVRVTFTLNTVPNCSVYFGSSLDGVSASFLGDSTRGIQVVDAQLEAGTTAGQYSPTTTAANSGPRFDYDPATPAGTVGAELVTNGLFPTDTSGWSSVAGATLSVVGSALSSSTPAGGGASQVMTTVVGKSYRVDGLISVGTASDVRVRVLDGAAPPSGTLLGDSTVVSSTTPTAVSVVFVAATTSTSIYLRNGAAGTGIFDNISVREAAFAPRGLLIEEARTNSLLHSRDMTQAAWTKTDVTAARTQVGIDGSANSACLMTEGAAGTSGTLQVATVTAAQTHTLSWVVKRGNTDLVRITFSTVSLANGAQGWFNLGTGVKGIASAIGAGTSISSTMTALGGGWYRCTVTGTVADAATTMNTNLYAAAADGSSTRVNNATYIVDCAQLEVGGFATSPIITGAATATRAADSAVMTGTNFSSWYNPTAGTFVAEFSRFGFDVGAGSVGIVQADDNSTNNRVALRLSARTTTVQAQQTVVVGGVLNVNEGVGISTSIDGIVVKAATAYQVGVGATGRNGTVVNNISNASLPTVTQLNIGQGPGAVTNNAWYRSIRYYNTRLQNATLQSLTT